MKVKTQRPQVEKVQRHGVPLLRHVADLGAIEPLPGKRRRDGGFRPRLSGSCKRSSMAVSETIPIEADRRRFAALYR